MTTLITALPADSVTVRFKEPYVSQGLNRKLYGLIGSGVVRGGHLATTGLGFGLSIVADPVTGDSIYSYQDASGHQLTVRQNGSVTLNMGPLAGTTVFVCLYVGYSTSGPTVVEWRAYTAVELFTAPVIEAAFVVILGKVVVPGAGPIPAGNVTPTARRMAWDDRAPPGWHQTVKNGNFEQALAAGASGFYGIQHWLATPTGSPAMQISTTAPYEGTREFQLFQAAPGVVNSRALFQEVVTRVMPGQYVRARVRVRGSTWGPIDPGGHQGINVVFLTNDLATVSSSWIEDITLSGTFAYTLLDGTVEVPATAAWMRVSVGMSNNGAVLPAGSLYFDDAKCWVESVTPLEEMFPENKLSESLLTEAVSFEPSFFDAPATMDDFVKRTIRFAKGAVGGVPAIDTLLGIMRGGDPWRLFLSQGQFRSDLWTAANALVARFVGQWTPNGVVGADYTFLMQFGAASAGINRIRFYARHGQYGGPVEGGDLNVTLNASWDGANWQQDDATRVSYRLRLSTAPDLTGRLSGLSFFYAPVGFGPFADANWKQTLNLGKAGDALEDAAIKFLIPTGFAGAIHQAMSGDVLGQPDFHMSQRLADGALIISQNAEFDPVGGLWNYDVGATTEAVRAVFLNGKIHVERFTGAGPTWAEGAWVQDASFNFHATAGGYLFLRSPGGSTGLDPGGNNRLLAENIPKTWAVLDTDGAGGVTIVDGFNVKPVGGGGTDTRLVGNVLHVYFARPFSTGTTNPFGGVVEDIPSNPIANFFSPKSLSGTHVEISVFDTTGALVTLSTVTRRIHLIGMGHQA